jgi:hypothetical protein
VALNTLLANQASLTDIAMYLNAHGLKHVCNPCAGSRLVETQLGMSVQITP